MQNCTCIPEVQIKIQKSQTRLFQDWTRQQNCLFNSLELLLADLQHCYLIPKAEACY